MPELPDVELYLHALRPRIGGERIESHLFMDGVAISGGFTLADEEFNDIVDEEGNTIIGHELDSFVFEVPPAPPLSTDRMLDASHAIGCVGKRLQMEVFESAGGEGMFLSQLLFDHMPLGPRPT